MKEKRYRNVNQFMKFPAKVRFCALVPKLFAFPQNFHHSRFNTIHAVLDTMLLPSEIEAKPKFYFIK